MNSKRRLNLLNNSKRALETIVTTKLAKFSQSIISIIAIFLGKGAMRLSLCKAPTHPFIEATC